MKQCVSGHDGVEHSLAGQTYKRVNFNITDGLQAESKRREYESEYLHFRNNTGINALTCIFGALTTIGL
jgi:hypothetical protein